ncbi:MAG: MazG nucleotide pyrophosphohydrolase domain-containing protein [Candidatus Hydrothermia bacterium]
MEIKDFQNLIKRIYFEKDQRRGKSQTFRWFIEEVGELAKAIRHEKNEELLEEFSDVCAWLFSLANLYGIEMEEAIKKYENGCPKCGKIPCVCGE